MSSQSQGVFVSRAEIDSAAYKPFWFYGTPSLSAYLHSDASPRQDAMKVQQHAWGMGCVRSCLISRTATETYSNNALLEAPPAHGKDTRSAVQPPEAELSARSRLGSDRIIFLWCSAHEPLVCTLESWRTL